MELKDKLNWTKILEAPRHAGGHEEVMEELFLDAEVVAKYIESSYQGSEYFIYKSSKEIIIITDYFGSCSGCDAWDDATDEEIKHLCLELANDAHRFSSLENALKFVKECPQEIYDVWKFKDLLTKELELLIAK